MKEEDDPCLESLECEFGMQGCPAASINIEASATEAGVKAELIRERAMTDKWWYMTSNQMWVDQGKATLKMNQETIEAFTQGQPFPLGEQDPGFWPVCKAYFKFMLRRTKPWSWAFFGFAIETVPAVRNYLIGLLMNLLLRGGSTEFWQLVVTACSHPLPQRVPVPVPQSPQVLHRKGLHLEAAGCHSGVRKHIR